LCLLCFGPEHNNKIVKSLTLSRSDQESSEKLAPIDYGDKIKDYSDEKSRSFIAGIVKNRRHQDF